MHWYCLSKLNTLPDFYYELLLWWSELRDVADCDGEYKYIVWNNREIKIDGKSVSYKHFFSKGIEYTEDLLYEKTNIDSFNAVRGERLLNSNFLTWTRLRQSVPLNRQTRPPTFNVVLDWEILNVVTTIGC